MAINLSENGKLLLSFKGGNFLENLHGVAPKLLNFPLRMLAQGDILSVTFHIKMKYKPDLPEIYLKLYFNIYVWEIQILSLSLRK